MPEPNPPVNDRRQFLRHSGALLSLAALGAPALLPGCTPTPASLELPATEELMQEHGLLRRLLLIFDEVARRLRCCQELAPGVLAEAAAITRTFGQDHHEKLEEEHLFPSLEKAGQLLALTKILRRQHEAGRRVLQAVALQANPGTAKRFVQRAQLEAWLTLFTRMYRPHAAREDTVLFPALRTLLSPAEFRGLEQKFAAATQERAAQDGFQDVLARVADLEKALGMHDLEAFTPNL